MWVSKTRRERGRASENKNGKVYCDFGLSVAFYSLFVLLLVACLALCTNLYFHDLHIFNEWIALAFFGFIHVFMCNVCYVLYKLWSIHTSTVHAMSGDTLWCLLAHSSSSFFLLQIASGIKWMNSAQKQDEQRKRYHGMRKTENI